MNHKKSKLFIISGTTFILSLIIIACAMSLFVSNLQNGSLTAHASEIEIQQESILTLDSSFENEVPRIEPYATTYSYHVLRIYYFSSVRNIDLGQPHKTHGDTVLNSQFNSQRTLQGLLSPLLEPGYYFAGWFTEKNGGGRQVKETDLAYTSATFSEQLDDNWNAYADYFHRIYAHYEPIVLPPNPTKEHHIFEGWYTDAALTTKYTGQGLTKDTTLYAKFTPKTYKITFITGFADCVVSDKSVTALTGGGAVNDVSKTGYIFKGWFTDAQKTKPYNPDTPITGNTEIFADWEVMMIKITFLVDGEVYRTLDVPYGSSLTELQAEPQLLGLNLLSVAFEDGSAGEFDENSLLLTGSATIIAEKKTIDQTITDTMQSNWVGVFLGIAFIAFIVIILSSVKRKKRVRG